jgi:hypothetical protein
MSEPAITINGHTLTSAQAMTVRVAIESFAVDLQAGLGDDEHGRTMTAAYKDRIREIRGLIFGERL